jgi:hypothetical protein
MRSVHSGFDSSSQFAAVACATHSDLSNGACHLTKRKSIGDHHPLVVPSRNVERAGRKCEVS